MDWWNLIGGSSLGRPLKKARKVDSSSIDDLSNKKDMDFKAKLGEW